jgi:hypothetical protein
VIRVVSERSGKPGRTREHFMGGDLDATKTIGCLTLSEAAGLPSAGEVLNQLGRRCAKIQVLPTAPSTPPKL